MNVEQGFWSRRADSIDLPDEADESARRRKRWLLIALAAAAALLVIWWLFLRGGPADEPTAPTLPRVTVIVPGKQQVTGIITATGNLAARREMPVGVAGEGGMVRSVLVEPGDWVAAGQTLAVIDRSVQSQESASLAASINVARADAALAQSELDRARALVARGFISKADIDRKTATRDSANARVRVAQAQFGQSRAQIGRLDIRAPAAGLVLARMVEPGQVVSSGSGMLFRVAKGGEMELRARMAEQDLARLGVGREALVTPVGTATSFRGQIWQMPPIIDPETRQGVARIALAYNPALRPGGFASTKITSGAVDAPLLPESAVQNDEKGAFVMIVGKDDKIERRDVKAGDINNKGVTILSGLSGNERVVLTAGAFLNPGEKVIPERAVAGK